MVAHDRIADEARWVPPARDQHWSVGAREREEAQGDIYCPDVRSLAKSCHGGGDHGRCGCAARLLGRLLLPVENIEDLDYDSWAVGNHHLADTFQFRRGGGPECMGVG